jgi:hypothetical protein
MAGDLSGVRANVQQAYTTHRPTWGLFVPNLTVRGFKRGISPFRHNCLYSEYVAYLLSLASGRLLVSQPHHQLTSPTQHSTHSLVPILDLRLTFQDSMLLLPSPGRHFDQHKLTTNNVFAAPSQLGLPNACTLERWGQDFWGSSGACRAPFVWIRKAQGVDS